MHYDFSCNGELKMELRTNKITYDEIAHYTYYSLQSIKLWLSHPISSDRELLVKQAIEEIKEDRRLRDG